MAVLEHPQAAGWMSPEGSCSPKSPHKSRILAGTVDHRDPCWNNLFVKVHSSKRRIHFEAVYERLSHGVDPMLEQANSEERKEAESKCYRLTAA